MKFFTVMKSKVWMIPFFIPKKELGTKSYLVDKEELISGLQDGFKIMKEGESDHFFIPFT